MGKLITTIKTFEYHTGGDFPILAVCRIMGSRMYVNFMFSNSADTVLPSQRPGNTMDIAIYADRMEVEEVIGLS